MRDENREVFMRTIKCCDDLYSKVLQIPHTEHQQLEDVLKTNNRGPIMESLSVFFFEIQALANMFSGKKQHADMKLNEDYQRKQTNSLTTPHENNNIQITANNDEISRRMEAFIQRKQLEVNAFNSKEFCKIAENDRDSTCARTDAAYIQRRGKKSIVEVSQVENEDRDEAEQFPTHKRFKNECVWTPIHPSTALNIEFLPPEIEERISSMESHLKLNKSAIVRKDLHHRISELESRILHLEGQSSEYFNGGHQAMLLHQPSQDLLTENDSNSPWHQAALGSIDDRISFLRKQLLDRKSNLIKQAEMEEDTKM